jgi:hypothetical protein
MEDFYENKINKKDEGFLKSLLEDDVSSFELTLSEKYKGTKMNVYYSSQKYLPKVEPFKTQGVVKIAITTDESFEKMLYLVVPFSSRVKLDKGIKAMEVIKETKPEKEYDEDFNFIFPDTVQNLDICASQFMKIRRFCTINSFQYDKKQNIFYIFFKPCKNLILKKI